MSSSRPSNGNFQRYYSIRRAHTGKQAHSSGSGTPSQPEGGGQGLEQDPRLTLLLQYLDAKGLKPKRILDVGCNSGRFTCALAQHMPQACVYGVDIDASLIRGAAAHARSLGLASSADPSDSRSAKRAKVDESSRRAPPSPIFRTADWPRLHLDMQQIKSKLVTTMQLIAMDQRSLHQQLQTFEAVLRDDEEGWDLICALSITKWIHLSHSDQGLRLLFARIASCLNAGGVLLLEPQPWKSYEQARRVIGKEGRGIHRGLTLRPQDFEWVLCEELGLDGVVKLGLTQGYGFKRPLYIYTQSRDVSEKVNALRKAVLRQEANFDFVARPFRLPKLDVSTEMT